MSDQFGRHKSTRWVKAEVPSYGDEWGDDYDSVPSPQPGTGDFPPPLPESNLVLSIDQIKHNDSDDSDESGNERQENDDGSEGEENDYDNHKYGNEGVQDEVVDTEADSHSLASNSTETLPIRTDHEATEPQTASPAVTAQVVSVAASEVPEVVPPTPTFSTHNEVASPASHTSFQSDADLIQHEPETLNVASPRRARESYEHDTPELEDQNLNDDELDNELEDVNADSKPTSAKPDLAPLVLSIDKAPVSDSDEDDWGYNSQHSSNEELDSPLKGLNVVRSDAPAERRHIQTDALDTLISDLEKASVGHDTDSFTSYKEDKETAFLPKLDSIQNISLPDFENTSFGHDDTFNDYTKEHEGFVAGLSGHRQSVRKPPPGETRNRKDLVSVDYANIAEAVSEYMNDDQKTIDSKPESNNYLVPVTSSNSSGSLSTGKFSLQSSREAENKELKGPQEPPADTDSFTFAPPQAEPDLDRRMSTTSAQTFNMGTWAPNTGNFRDQFISDNDNESQINFNPYAASESSNYNKFTKLRNTSGFSFETSSTTSSNASSLSVPETIDAALPNIKEGAEEDSTDDEKDFTSTVSANNSLEQADTNYTVDSIFKERVAVPTFQEKLTPGASKDDLVSGGSRNVSDTSTSSNTEIMSDAATEKRVTSTNTQDSKQYIQQPRPSYNWKKIMALSQPVDRINSLQDALAEESEYDTGLQNWLHETLKVSENPSSIHVGRIASQAYQNATHSELRRHTSIRSKVSMVKDKVETGGLVASGFGKRFLSRGKRLMKSSD